MMIRRLIGLGWPPIVSPVTAAVTVTEARSMHATPVLLKAPGPKAKSKADPMVVKAREEKRQKRLRKALVKMERKDRLPRPLIENELPIEIRNELDKRQRHDAGSKVTSDVVERRELMIKDWSRFAGKRHLAEIASIDRMIVAQQKALEALRSENRDLYLAAIQPDETMVNFKASGPTRTPPIPEYIQDGDYMETTKKFEVQYENMNEYLRQLVRKKKKRKKKVEEEEDED